MLLGVCIHFIVGIILCGVKIDEVLLADEDYSDNISQIMEHG